MKKYTHAELCTKAANWLKRGHTSGGYGCPNAFSEIPAGSNGGEIPDAIGIKTAEGIETIVIEVKVSVQDFKSDHKKPHRKKPESGMGNYRYYMCPEGMIQISDLPDKWGLIEVGERGVITVVHGHKAKGSTFDDFWVDSNRDAELSLCSIMLARLRKAKAA